MIVVVDTAWEWDCPFCEACPFNEDETKLIADVSMHMQLCHREKILAWRAFRAQPILEFSRSRIGHERWEQVPWPR